MDDSRVELRVGAGFRRAMIVAVGEAVCKPELVQGNKTGPARCGTAADKTARLSGQGWLACVLSGGKAATPMWYEPEKNDQSLHTHIANVGLLRVWKRKKELGALKSFTATNASERTMPFLPNSGSHRSRPSPGFVAAFPCRLYNDS